MLKNDNYKSFFSSTFSWLYCEIDSTTWRLVAFSRLSRTRRQDSSAHNTFDYTCTSFWTDVRVSKDFKARADVRFNGERRELSHSGGNALSLRQFPVSDTRPSYKLARRKRSLKPVTLWDRVHIDERWIKRLMISRAVELNELGLLHRTRCGTNKFNKCLYNIFETDDLIFLREWHFYMNAT